LILFPPNTGSVLCFREKKGVNHKVFLMVGEKLERIIPRKLMCILGGDPLYANSADKQTRTTISVENHIDNLPSPLAYNQLFYYPFRRHVPVFHSFMFRISTNQGFAFIRNEDTQIY
jgi:hypothetical protein